MRNKVGRKNGNENYFRLLGRIIFCLEVKTEPCAEYLYHSNYLSAIPLLYCFLMLLSLTCNCVGIIICLTVLFPFISSINSWHAASPIL